jgi:hypothetical protein
MKFVLPLAVAALAAAAPASAVTYADYNIVFTSGFTVVSSGPKLLPGEYQDNFHFHVDTASVFSGSLSTQRLSVLGNIVSDLDFGNTLVPDGVHIDSTYFTLASGGSDMLEVQSMPGTLLLPGDHVLTVNYTVQFADSLNAAAYSGPLFLAASVPEPGTWALMLLGVGTVGAAMRRQRRLARVNFA